MKNRLYTLFLTVPLLAMGMNCSAPKKDALVKIHTPYGTMTVLLYEETPLHKENFLALAEDGSYDSTIFHRVIKNFMIQGGNIAEKTGVAEEMEDRIPAEIYPNYYHVKGALAAARQGDQVNPEKKSSSSQFYIVQGQPWEMLSTDLYALNRYVRELLQDTSNREFINEYTPIFQERDPSKMMDFLLSKKSYIEEKMQVTLTKQNATANDSLYKAMGGGSPHLDGEYTIFGRVVEGLDVIDSIAAVATSLGDRPKDDIFMHMELVKMSKKKITAKYGYPYP